MTTRRRKETPCLYLFKEKGIPDQNAEDGTILAGTRARAECLTTDPAECPKDRFKHDITELCHRITGRPRKKQRKEPTGEPAASAAGRRTTAIKGSET
jgi:hypothetical protein